MILIVRTESGSVYELDGPGRRVRRVHGEHEPTPRQGIDGEWKSVIEADRPEVGRPMVFVWAIVDEIAKLTVTSRVVSITTEN